MEQATVVYVGFWRRAIAGVVDVVLGITLSVFTELGLLAVAGWDADHELTDAGDVFVDLIVPSLATLAFWIVKQATPGKMLIRARIVDARTGGRPSAGQLAGRYVAYLLSFLPWGLGFIWVGIDQRKQGWHDKLAGTLVVFTDRGIPHAAAATAGPVELSAPDV